MYFSLVHRSENQDLEARLQPGGNCVRTTSSPAAGTVATSLKDPPGISLPLCISVQSALSAHSRNKYILSIRCLKTGTSLLKRERETESSLQTS